MDESSARGEAERLDLRMEYASLATAFIATSAMYWSGFTAFFAANTLLATALGFSYSQTATQLASSVIKIIRLGLPLLGVAVAALAIVAALILHTHQKFIVRRGIEIDQILATRSATQFGPACDKPPIPTVSGALLFMMVWGTIAYVSLRAMQAI